MDKEKLIKKIMRECEKDGEPVTYEEATEMAEMETKAGGIKHNAKADTAPRARKTERKVDTAKLEILKQCRFALTEMGVENITGKTETELSFTFGDGEYTIKLIKHRKPTE